MYVCVIQLMDYSGIIAIMLSLADTYFCVDVPAIWNRPREEDVTGENNFGKHIFFSSTPRSLGRLLLISLLKIKRMSTQTIELEIFIFGTINYFPI